MVFVTPVVEDWLEREIAPILNDSAKMEGFRLFKFEMIGI